MTATAGVAGVTGITGPAGLTGGTPYVSYVLTLPKRASAVPTAGAGAVPTAGGGLAPAAEVAPDAAGARDAAGAGDAAGAPGAPLAATAGVTAAPATVAAAPVRQGIRRSGFTVSADGSYASCLAYRPDPRGVGGPDVADGTGTGTPGRAGTGTGMVPGPAPAAASTDAAGSGAGARWCVERWTLRGPEAYAVPLPVDGPEDAGTPTLPLADGRVLVLRRAGDCHEVTLLYPSGTGTGQARAGSLPGPGVRLLPPCPAPGAAYALTWDEDRTVVWRVYGTAHGAPEPVLTLDGHCTGGVWLDRTGRLLALDREIGGPAKSVAVDLYEGTARPLLNLTDDSDDRLLLADPDSGLMMLRSDATGETRLGWGVLGSGRPVRFPDALCVPGTLLTPVAVRPGQFLSAEATVVALRGEVPGGAASLALWRPGGKGVRWLPAPEGWLGPVGLWLPGTPLRLPYAADVTDAAPLSPAAAPGLPGRAAPDSPAEPSAWAHPAAPGGPVGSAAPGRPEPPAASGAPAGSAGAGLPDLTVVPAVPGAPTGLAAPERPDLWAVPAVPGAPADPAGVHARAAVMTLAAWAAWAGPESPAGAMASAAPDSRVTSAAPAGAVATTGSADAARTAVRDDVADRLADHTTWAAAAEAVSGTLPGLPALPGLPDLPTAPAVPAAPATPPTLAGPANPTAPAAPATRTVPANSTALAATGSRARAAGAARSAADTAVSASPHLPPEVSDCGLAAYDIPPAGDSTEDRTGDGTGDGSEDRTGDGARDGSGGTDRAPEGRPGAAGPDRAARPPLRAPEPATAGGARRGVRVVRDSRRALPLRRALAVLPLQQAPLAASLAAPLTPPAVPTLRS